MKKFAISIFIVFVLCACVWAEEPFPLKDVEVEYVNLAGMSRIIGEVTNNSGKSYQMATFKLSFYDESGKLLGAADFLIHNLKEGETVTFESASEKNVSAWKTCKIRLDSSI